MTNPLPHVLLVTEGVTRQQAALRVDPDAVPCVGDGLELFRRDPDEHIDRGLLRAEARNPYLEVGECLYNVNADGELGEMHKWLKFLYGHEPVEAQFPLLFERRALPDATGREPREVMLAEITLDRRDCLYDRDWQAFHRRKAAQAGPELDAFLHAAALQFLGEKRAEQALARKSDADRELLLEAAARRVFDAPFELYTRFVGQRRLIKDGVATLRGILAGNGGACSEKAQVMRFIADALEIPARYVICGPDAKGEVPEDSLLEILETFDVQYSKAVQAYWNHVAIIVELGGREILVDATNGNIPFLWVGGDELTAMLDRRGKERRGVPHRYVVGYDELFFHRVDQRVPERLLYALELGWADPHIDLVQVIDDELGLLTMPDLWLGVLAYRDSDERQAIRDWYQEKWLEPGLIRGAYFGKDPAADEGDMADELRRRYPAAAQAATDGHEYIEARLEEANPGALYQVDFVAIGRREDLPTDKARLGCAPTFGGN